jgi:hypothetical protein
MSLSAENTDPMEEAYQRFCTDLPSTPESSQCLECLHMTDTQGRVPISNLAASPCTYRCELLVGHKGAHQTHAGTKRKFWYTA